MSPQTLAGRAVMRHGHRRRLEGHDAVYDYACTIGVEGLAWQPELHWPTADGDPMVRDAYLAGRKQRRDDLADQARAGALKVARAVAAVLYVAWRIVAEIIWTAAALIDPKGVRRARRHCRRWVRDWRAYRRSLGY
jgi:hypothetical protein